MSVLNRYLNIDVAGNRLVLGADSDTDQTLDPFRQGDVEPIVVTLLKRSSVWPYVGNPPANPFSKIAVSGLSCEVGIGALDPSNDAGSTPGIFQDSFLTDTVNQTLTGILSIDNAAAASLLAGANSVQVPFYVRITEAGNVKTVYSSEITIVAKMIPASATPPSPVTSYPTWAQVNSTFVLRKGLAGQTFMTVSPSGQHGTIWGTNDDGSPIMDYVDLS